MRLNLRLKRLCKHFPMIMFCSALGAERSILEISCGNFLHGTQDLKKLGKANLCQTMPTAFAFDINPELRRHHQGLYEILTF